MHADAASTRARAAATLLALIAIVGIGLRYPAPPIESHATGRTDFALFEAVVDGLKVGGPYYEVMARELSTRGYPTESVFNWRLPFYLELLSLGPIQLWRGVLVVLLATLVAATAVALRPAGKAALLAGLTLQAGVLVIFAAPALIFLGDTWAGALLGLSTTLQLFGRGAAAAVAALLALAFRELAAPYCVVSTLIAAANRRGRELTVWVGGAILYGLFYAWHARHVWAQAVPEHAARVPDWLQLGGVPFLLSAIRWTGFAFVLPSVGLAVLLALICAGIANPRGTVHVRAAAAVYAGFFLFIGQPFNHYWGLVAAPVWVFAIVSGTQLVADEYSALSAAPYSRGPKP